MPSETQNQKFYFRRYYLWLSLILLSTFFRPLVVALGAGLGIWGAINLLEGYGNDNPGAKSQGVSDALHGQIIAVQRMVQFHTATD